MHPDVADRSLFGEEIALAHDEVGHLTRLDGAVGSIDAQPVGRCGGEGREGIVGGEPPGHGDAQVG